MRIRSPHPVSVLPKYFLQGCLGFQQALAPVPRAVRAKYFSNLLANAHQRVQRSFSFLMNQGNGISPNAPQSFLRGSEQLICTKSDYSITDSKAGRQNT